MASLLEIYKAQQDIEQNDVELLQKLYNESSYYQRNYKFDDFVFEATKDSEKPLDENVKKLMAPTLPPKDIDYREKFTVEEPRLLSKETRRTIGGIYDNILQGSINTIIDMRGGPIEAGMRQLRGVFDKDERKKQLLFEQAQKETVQKGVSRILKPIVGDDVYDETAIQEPETLGGEIGKTIGSILGQTVARSTVSARNIGNLSKQAVEQTVKKGAKEKTARLLSDRTKEALKSTAKIELDAQVVFRDNPEMTVVADFLNDKIEKNQLTETQLGKVIDWLDADMDDLVAQRRLSLLLDGGVFAGLFGAGIYGAKGAYSVSKEGVSKALMTIKKNPKAVELYKKTLQPLQEQITKRLPTEQVDDVFVRASGDDVFTKFLNGARWMRRGLFTSRGMKSQEMFDIIKRADAAKLGIQKEARNLFDTINYRMREAGKKENLSPEQLNKYLDDFMTGKADIKSLPALMREPAYEARKYIDDLSKVLLDSPIIPNDIKKVIRLNMGKYLRESYEIFENPKYKASQEVIDRAVNHIARQLQAAPVQLQMFDNTAATIAKDVIPSAENIAKATNIVDDILSMGAQYKGLTTDVKKHLDVVFSKSAPEIQFAAKKNIDDAIKDLLGRERLDTSTAIFRSISNLGTFIADTKMFDDLYKAGQGKWFFKEGDKYLGDVYRTASQIGENYGSLSGARTTPEIARMFEAMTPGKPAGWLSRAWSAILTAKGFGQAFATVYSFTTHARNTIGGAWIMASNGLNPFDKESRDAFKLLKNEIFTVQKNKNKALQDLYVKYQKLGLVNQNVRKGEFTDLINESANVNWMNKAGEKFNKLQTTKQYAKAANDAIVKTYVAEDDLWRIAAFRKELKVLQDAFPNRSVEELEEEAAKIIRNTMPTYDMVPEFAKNLRKAPIGNFYSFFAERWRNNYHTVRQGIDEIRSGNEVLVTRGYQRLSSKLALGYMGAEGINEATKFAYGVTNEEEQAIRDLSLPFWSENSTLGFKRDAQGNLQWVDLSYSDPDAPVIDVLKSSLNVLLDPKTPSDKIDTLLAESIMTGAKNFVKPFLSESLLFTSFIESYRGRDSETGEYIKGYNPQNTAFENAMAVVNRIGYEVLTPAQIRETIELPEKISKGKITISDYLVSELTGQKFYTSDSKSLNTSLYFKIKEFTTAKENVDNILKDGIKDATSTEDLLKLYIDVNDKLYDDAVRLNKAIRGARFLNVSELDIETTGTNQLSRAGFDSSEIDNILEAGLYFTPIRLKESDLRKIYDLNDYNTLNFNTFITEYDKLYSKLSSLPLVKLDKEVDEELEAVKIRNGGYRLQKATGGLVEGPDVPFTKENPADRVDPFTGQPYQEQMSRLGFGNE